MLQSLCVLLYSRQPGDLAAGRSCRGRAHLCHQARGARFSCSSLQALKALSEDLNVMERSPNLLLHFADENLEPSASRGLNAFVDHFTVAMKRSTSPNTGSKSGPQLIETAPRDGGFLILEEASPAAADRAKQAA
jgi:hypothetical protein